MKLIITEKPSVAQTLAAILGATQRRDGYFEGNGWLISWCYGHLVEMAPADAYGEQYKRWSYDSLPILPDVWKYRAADGKKKQLDILRSLMNLADVDAVVCGTDAGREGELIFRWVYDQCKCKKSVQRLWISSLEDTAVREGFSKLRPGSDFDNLYRAALCRAKADFVVGINATRLFSCLYGTTLNVGRVQSPTLALIVSREAAVLSFLSEPFYTPEINCGEFAASGEKQSDADAAEAVRAAADGRDAAVLSVEKTKKSAAPPKLLDLTALQREANRLFGYTAQQTLDYAQSLYERKLITYPRVDSRYLTGDMRDTVRSIVEWIQKDMDYQDGADFSPDIGRLINDKAVTDHHAIIPTTGVMKTDTTALPSGECDILNLIVCRLLCAAAPAHVFEATAAVLECGGNEFTAKGRTVIADGWKAIDTAYKSSLKQKPEAGDGKGDDDGEGDSVLPGLAKGQTFPTVTATVREGKTSPPKRHTEDTLLSAMETAGAEGFPDDAERKGLGTPATRAATIEKLIKAGFVQRQKKSLVPTNKGISLIAVLPEDIKSPLLTAEWEQKLKLVEKGGLSDSEFMDGIATLTKGLVAAHRVPVEEYAKLFAASAAPADKGAAKPEKIIGPCPRCGSGVIASVKSFFCSGKGCGFSLWTDNRFFAAKKKKLTKAVAAALLTEGRVFFSDLHSEKTGKTYAATILLDDTGDRINFKLDFTKGRNNK